MCPGGFAGLTGVYAGSLSGAQTFSGHLSQSPFLSAAALIALAFGIRKRGVSWWGLTASLLVGLFHLITGGSHPYGWIPFLVLLSLALVKVPVLLDIRHPRSVQSLLLCQLILWIPPVFF
jgi:hypothetical protein